MHSNGSSFMAAQPDEAAGNCDRLISTELEVAEALAGLAQSSEIREKEAAAAESWGNKGKRAYKKRVKGESESPPLDSVVVFQDMDLTQDGTYKELPEGRNIDGDTATKPVGGVENAVPCKDLPKVDNINPATGAGRSRNTLTEDEKEAKRIRRILANRESARQTIRRRQALYDELNKKAADLSSENDKLKREKELALKEYQSLEITNKHLKAEVSNAMKAQAEEAQAGHNSVHVNTSPSPSANCQLLLYNRIPLMQVCWPPIIQSSDASQRQNQSQSPLFVPANIPLPVSGIVNVSQEQENSVNFNVPRTPCYMVSYPCFFPFPDNGNGIYQQPSIHLQNVQDETSVDNHHSTSSSSKNIARVENNNSSFPVNVKTEASCFAEAKATTDLNELPMDESGQYVEFSDKEVSLPTWPENAVGTTYTETGSQQSDLSANDNRILIEASFSASVFLEKNEEPTSHLSKKLVDAVAAAEARKKRKEVTKLKNIHGRERRM